MIISEFGLLTGVPDMLTNFRVSPNPDPDDSVVAKCDHGADRVVVRIHRYAIDDYLQRRQLSYIERIQFVERNAQDIKAIAEKKLLAGQVSKRIHTSTSVLVVSIGLHELKSGPVLS
jgi:hypothetical protein